MTIPICIFHQDCPDGVLSAAIVANHFGHYHANNASLELVPALHDDDPPEVVGRDVIIADFSWDAATMVWLAEHARTLTVLDHHEKSLPALAAITGMPGVVVKYSADRSGAGITWDHFHGTESRPWLVNYVEDRDIWKHSLPGSREMGAWILAQQMSVRHWQGLLGGYPDGDEPPGDIWDAASAMRDSQLAFCRAVAGTAERGRLAGHQIPVVNSPHPLGSDLLEILYQGEPFAARWQRRSDGLYQYSLASGPDGLDVGEIAVGLGGGGHRHASGFVSRELIHMEAP